MTLDVTKGLYSALSGNSDITSLLGSFQGGPSIHTRRPVPVNAVYPMIVVSSDVSVTDEDGLVSRRPVVIRDIAIYGEQDTDYRTVESLGYLVRSMFHRKLDVFTVDGYSIIDVVATGPIPAPTDDEKQVGRLVSLTIRLLESA